MSKSYTKKQLETAIIKSNEQKAQIFAMFRELDYDEKFWNSTADFSEIPGKILYLEDVAHGMKANESVTGDLAETITNDLEFIKSCYEHIKKYHGRNARAEHTGHVPDHSIAQGTFDAIENIWKPRIEAAIKGKRWTEATTALLAMPYKHKQNAHAIYNRNLTDKSIIKQCKELDQFIVTICAKIPVKAFEAAAKEFYQNRLDAVCAKAAAIGEALSNEFGAQKLFSLDKLPDGNFLSAKERALRDVTCELVDTDLDYHIFLKLREEKQEKTND